MDRFLQSRKVKSYYINEERYDWLTDPRRLEKIYHRLRAIVYLKNLQKIKRSSWILDAGCGTGLITIHMHPPVVGVDLNLWNLRRLQSRLRDKELIQADLEHLPFRDNCVSIVSCTEVLEHLPSPEKAIREFYRVLKDEGVFIGTVPSIHPVWRFRRYLLTTCPVSEPFHRNYTSRQIREMLKIFPKIKVKCFLLGLNIFFESYKTST
ncbi:MAG: class I SAM-dependent methyltransferase [Aigarchaeota archaeon]|nr:class I SAM-dependent methyltransferase [Aigarchaeota archaeon]MCX8192204.1 class I SAM-dependent methyltransferase [Nitrososphaeria archaeon]MDW7986190.1 methyltransferase domain-containing protein [Nitrososphaerota archaeon]